MLEVALPADLAPHKGKLLPLRYDPSRFILLPGREITTTQGIPTSAIPPIGETR
jgi:hypothetical protein